MPYACTLEQKAPQNHVSEIAFKLILRNEWKIKFVFKTKLPEYDNKERFYCSMKTALVFLTVIFGFVAAEYGEKGYTPAYVLRNYFQRQQFSKWLESQAFKGYGYGAGGYAGVGGFTGASYGFGGYGSRSYGVAAPGLTHSLSGALGLLAGGYRGDIGGGYGGAIGGYGGSALIGGGYGYGGYGFKNQGKLIL